MCIMWGRTGRQFIGVMAIVSLIFVSSMLYDVITSDHIWMEGRGKGVYDRLTNWMQQEEDNSTASKDPGCSSCIKEEAVNISKTRSDALKGHLQQICKNFNIMFPLTSFTLDHMHFDHKRKAIYCFTPKVACTSWKRIWMKMTGLVNPEKDLSELTRYTIHSSIPTLASQSLNITEILLTYKKFMFVRHPFDRVLSAYKDKLEHEDKESSYDFHKQIGARIQRKYRKPGPDYQGDNVTFSEFIQFISVPVHGTPEQRNEHWLSVHDICNPCRVEYDFVGKYENLKEDAQYVLKWIGAADLVKEFPVSDRPFHAGRYDPKYFNQLNHVTKVAFFKKYFLDFAAFNYSYV